MFKHKGNVMADYGPQKILNELHPQDPVRLSSGGSKSSAKKEAAVLQTESPRFRYYIERIK